MRKLILCLIIALCACVATRAQSSPCPQGLVCITPEAARTALENSDKVVALEAELKVKDQAIADQKEVSNSLKIELAKLMGEKTQLEASAVRYTAIIDALLKAFKKSHKFGIININ